MATTTTDKRMTMVREGLGLTKAALAKSLGVAESTVYAWERTDKPAKPSAAHLERLFEVHGVRVRMVLVTPEEAQLLVQARALGGTEPKPRLLPGDFSKEPDR